MLEFGEIRCFITSLKIASFFRFLKKFTYSVFFQIIWDCSSLEVCVLLSQSWYFKYCVTLIQEYFGLLRLFCLFWIVERTRICVRYDLANYLHILNWNFLQPRYYSRSFLLFASSNFRLRWWKMVKVLL